MPEALDRVEHCFSAIEDHYFSVEGQTLFNHLHSDQYSMFLYILSRTVYDSATDQDTADKLYGLNRALSGIDAPYVAKLPDIFRFTHPVGTVLGRADYSDYLIVYHGCTIGRTFEHDPVLGKHLTVYPGGSIIGKCRVGDNCTIGANSFLLDQDLEPNSVYSGTPGNHTIRKSEAVAPSWRRDA